MRTEYYNYPNARLDSDWIAICGSSHSAKRNAYIPGNYANTRRFLKDLARGRARAYNKAQVRKALADLG